MPKKLTGPKDPKGPLSGVEKARLGMILLNMQKKIQDERPETKELLEWSRREMGRPFAMSLATLRGFLAEFGIEYRPRLKVAGLTRTLSYKPLRLQMEVNDRVVQVMEDIVSCCSNMTEAETAGILEQLRGIRELLQQQAQCFDQVTAYAEGKKSRAREVRENKGLSGQLAQKLVHPPPDKGEEAPRGVEEPGEQEEPDSVSRNGRERAR